MQHRSTCAGIAICLLVLGILVSNVSAANSISASLNRENGYNFGSDIQGLFSISVDAPKNLTFVAIYFNGTEVANSTVVPFSWSFNTDNYSLGLYNITVWGNDSQNNVYDMTFMSNFVIGPDMTPYLILIGVVIGVIIVVAVVGRYLKTKRQSKQVKKAVPFTLE